MRESSGTGWKLLRAMRANARICVRPCVALAALLLCTTIEQAGAQGLTLPLPLTAGGVSLVHESWSIADGLPVNSINQLIQTHDGYLWAATFDGLVRFDGVRFRVYNTANTPELPSNRWLSLYEGADGDLWAVSEVRDIVRMRHGRFKVIATTPMLARQYQTVLLEPDGAAWIGTSHGLSKVVGDTLVPVLPAIIKDTVHAIIRRRDGTLLVGMARDGLLALRTGANGDFTAESIAFDTMPRRSGVITMFEDAHGVLWVTSLAQLWTGRQLLRSVPTPYVTRTKFLADIIVDAPNGNGVLFRAYGVYHADSTHTVSLDASAPRYPHAPLWVNGGDTWYATGSTLVRNGVPLTSLTTDKRLAAYDITTAIMDREGSIWLGTFAAGLHRLKPSVFTTYSVVEGLRDRNVYPVYADHRGTIWVGTWTQGFSSIDPSTGTVHSFGSDAVPPRAVRSFLETRDGTLWIGTNGQPAGLYRCARAPTLQCRTEPFFEGGQHSVSALYEDVDGRIWAGTQEGLFRRDLKTWKLLDASTGAPTDLVRAFAVTRDGALWMGTNRGGVVRYREGTFTTVSTADGLPSDVIRSLYVDHDGWLWIGTEGRGLARLDPRAWGDGATDKSSHAQRIATISVREGLFDNVVHQILEDDSDRLWMNTNRGVFWIERSEAIAVADGRASRVHSTGYTERDGMRNREGNGGVQPAGAKGLDGRLWFPTQDGVVVVDPRTVRRDTLAPPIVIEQAVVADSVLLPVNSTIRFSPAERDVRIEFTALTFLEPRNVRFRYFLEGYDKTWVDGENRRSAFYTQVPPGTYTFRVEARGAAGEWLNRNTSLTLVFAPHFYERVLFRILLLAALAAILVFMVRRGVLASRLRAERLEWLVADRTASLREREQRLEEQNQQLVTQAAQLQQLDTARTRFLTNVSHELRTPLTLTLGPLEDLRAQTTHDPRAERWLEIAIRNSRRLLGLVNQILDIAKLEAGAMHLSPRPIELVAFMCGIASSFQSVVERKRIHLGVELPERCDVMIDPDAIEKIVTNLLSNAVKFTPFDGSIVLSLKCEGDGVVLAISNSGPAIAPEQLAHLFERFYQVDESHTTVQPGTGIGLSLVKELVELQRGVVRVTSDDQGTVFVVTLPVPDSDGVVVRPAKASPQLATSRTTSHDGEAAEMVLPTMLIVDDSEDLRSYIREHFANRFHVIEAGDGLAGLALARKHLPDVVLSDVMMPEMDGRELVGALRASRETDFLAIVLLTAQAEGEQKLAGLEGGADDYIVKPFEMRELDIRVRNILAARSRLQARMGGDALGRPDSLMTSCDLAFNANTPDAEPGVPTLSSDDIAYRERVLQAARAGLSNPDFGVAELARDVFQDRSHLFRRVREVIGSAPSELLRNMRVDEGARLLASGSGTVADVAYSVGFKSVSHFCRCFHERFAVTPATYRASAGRRTSASV